MDHEPIMRTVSEIAEITGVTVRTLHHYDELGLLVPSERSEGGYRLYSPDDLTRLREILTWRRLGVSLKEIAPLLDDPETDRLAVLRAQRAAVEQQRSELVALATALDAAIDSHEKESSMTKTDQSIIDALDGFEPAEYEQEAAERWGGTDAYKQSTERTKNYSAADWAEVKAEADEIVGVMADLFTEGVKPDDQRARDAAERHRKHISQRFYDCTPGMHAGLGEMYANDRRFRETMERSGELPGFAEWLNDAFAANAGSRAPL